MAKLSDWLCKQGVSAGEWYGEAKAFARAAARAVGLSADALLVLIYLRLHTMAYQSELAVTMLNGKRRRVTPSDVAEGTGLSRQHVRGALAELEAAGYAERKPIGEGGLRKGNVAIYCWTLPHQVDKPSNSLRPTFGLSTDVLKLLRRFKIQLPADFVAPSEYKEFVEAVAKRYKESEMVAAREAKAAFFVAPGAPAYKVERKTLKETAVRGVRGDIFPEPPPSSSSLEEPTTERAKAADSKENPLRTKLQNWMLANLPVPGFPLEAATLDEIATTITTDEDLVQFQEAAVRQKNPRGWRVYVTIAERCAEQRPHYQKAKAAATGSSGNTKAAEFARKRRTAGIQTDG